LSVPSYFFPFFSICRLLAAAAIKSSRPTRRTMKVT
jgi:hypothetical protein